MEDNKHYKNLTLYQVAKQYIEIGLSVIPLKPQSKSPITSWKEYQERLTKEEELHDWFYNQPGLNIGIVCGKVSNNLVVLDFDNEEVYLEWLKKYSDLIKKTWVVKTARGFHVYLRMLELSRTFQFKGGELKGEGGYVVAPPSIHPSGKKYEFTNFTEKIATINSLESVDIYSKPKQNEHQEEKWWKEALKGVSEGRRNKTGIRLAGLWNYDEKGRDEILRLLLDWNTRNEPPLPSKEIEDIAESVIKYPSNLKKISQNKKSGSLTDRLLDYAMGTKLILFHDQINEPYVSVPIKGHRETWRLNSRQFDYWLSNLMNENEKKVLNSEVIRSVRRVLASKAIFDGEERKLFNRVAEYNGKFWYDLTDLQWRAICVDQVGWRIVKEPPILFKRYAHQKAQVEPKEVDHPDQKLEKLFDFVHIEDKNERLLIMVYLISAFIAGFPHPIIVLHGEKGSGKTIACKILRSLIDPSVSEVLSFTRDERELIQIFSHHWACYFDNITSIPDWEQDALCRACTGQGFTKRRLYTDEEDVIFNFQRCIALNGINLTVTRSDLMDRALIFELSHLRHKNTERGLWSEFEDIKPRLLGAIFAIFSKALNYYQEGLDHAGTFRMADFAAWGYAITKSLGKDGNKFVEVYSQHIKEKAETTLELHPLGQAIIAFGNKYLGEIFEKKWKGSPSELLEKLDGVTKQEKIDTTSKIWPQAANWLGRRLKEIQSDLRENGIDVESKKVGGKRLIFIEWH